MANEKQLRTDLVAGALSASLATGDTTMSSAGLADLGAITATDHAAITLFSADSVGRIMAKEIVYVTAHTAAATTATILRAQEGSTAVAWASSTTWAHTATAKDFNRPLLLTAALSSNVAVTPTNTFVDVLTLSLTPGTWRCTACGVYQSNGGWLVLKIWDGTTAYASVSGYQGVVGGAIGLTIPSVDITVAATTTIKLSAATDGSAGSPSILAIPPITSTGLSGTMTRFYAEKVT